MKLTLFAVFAAVGLAACANASQLPASPSPSSPGPAPNEPSCAAPHGFALAGEAGPPLATDADVAEVRVVRDPERAQAAMSIRLHEEAGARVQRYTAAHVGEHVTVSIGDRVVTRAVIRDPIGGTVLVTGSSEADVAEMRGRLCGR